MTIALETRSLTKQFGGLTAVDSVDLVIQENCHLQRHRPKRRREDHLL